MILTADKAPADRRRTRSNGEGSVWHDKARDRWVGSVTTGYRDGRQVRKSVTGKTKREVVEKLRQLQNAHDAGIELVRADLTVARFLEGWVTDVLPGTVRPATLQQYRDVVRLYIVPVIGQKRLRTLQARDVVRMQRYLAEEYVRTDGTLGVAPHTQRIARSVLRRALRWAEQEGQVSRNVASIAHGVRIDADEGRTLTPDQARQLLDHVAGRDCTKCARVAPHRCGLHRHEAAIVLGLALGLRLGELLGLAWPDVELDSGQPRLTVVRALKRASGQGLALEDVKTKTSRRTVYLPDLAVAALREHRVRQLEEADAAGTEWVTSPLGVDLVFRTPFGTAIDPRNFRAMLYRLTETAGLGRWSPHELRHSAASLLIAMGVPLKVVSETLGHSSIRITADVYGHLLEPDRVDAAQAMQRALGGRS
jgi:integrase